MGTVMQKVTKEARGSDTNGEFGGVDKCAIENAVYMISYLSCFIEESTPLFLLGVASHS